MSRVNVQEDLVNTFKEEAQEADFQVACAARLFLRGHATARQLQAVVDKQEAMYDAWDKAQRASG